MLYRYLCAEADLNFCMASMCGFLLYLRYNFHLQNHTDNSSSNKGSELSVSGAVGLTFSLTFITAFILGATFVLVLCYFLPSRSSGHVDLPAAQEVAEAAAIYDLPTNPVRDNKSEPLTSDNTGYGVRHGPSTTTNPAYELVQRLLLKEPFIHE